MICMRRGLLRFSIPDVFQVTRCPIHVFANNNHLVFHQHIGLVDSIVLEDDYNTASLRSSPLGLDCSNHFPFNPTLFFIPNFTLVVFPITFSSQATPDFSKMVNRNFLLGALAAAATSAIAQDSGSENIRFGNAFSLGATNSYIIEAETTLFPGKTQSGDTPRLALWPGMGTDQNQLIQAIVLGSSDAQGEQCGGKPHVSGEWCAFASALQDDVQLQGDTFPVKSNQGVKIHCTFSASFNPYLYIKSAPTNLLSHSHRQIRRNLWQHHSNRVCGRKSRLHTQHEIRQGYRLWHRRGSPE